MTAANRPSVTPRVGDTITTAEQLDALWRIQDVLIEATGTYANGMGSFTECWARPVPEFVGGEPGTWEVLVFGTELPHSLTTSDRIDSATVLYVPGEKPRPSAEGAREWRARYERLVLSRAEWRDRAITAESALNAAEPMPQDLAEAFELGRQAEREYRARQDDADAAGQGVQIPFPVNPHGDTATHWANGVRRLLTPEAHARTNRGGAR